MEHNEEINSQPVPNEETRIQKQTKKETNKKHEERTRRLWDISKSANIQIIGMAEEGEEQEIENLFEKIMKENIPILAKEIDMQVQEAQRIPNKLDPKRTTLRHIIIKVPTVKEKERILKTAEVDSYLQRSSHKTVS